MSAELVEFLRQRLAEDEAVARAANPAEGWFGPWELQNLHMTPGVASGAVTQGKAEHIAAHGPRRVLAEVEAKRAILGRLDHELATELRNRVEGGSIVPVYFALCSCGWEEEIPGPHEYDTAFARHRATVGVLGRGEVVAEVLALLALPYSDHPDYRAEWRP